MKRWIAAVLALVMVLAFAACAKKETPAPSTTEAPKEEVKTEVKEEPKEEPKEEQKEEAPAPEETAPAVMTHAEYIAAELDTEVVVETYVQAKQSWWDNKVTVYSQDEDGAYFLYNMACSEEDYAKLTPGTKIRVTGFKSEWSGEVEIVDATFEIIEGTFVAEPEDVTALLGTDELIDHQNELVCFKGMTVEASKDANGNDVPFLYNWDGSGEDGNDLYFNVSYEGQTYNFTVESDLCGKDTDVYAAVKALNIGDKIDMEGFLYWYEGVNPHITAVTPAN